MYCVSCEVRTKFIYAMYKKVDRICGLVVSVPGCRSRDTGSIHGAIRFSEKYMSGTGSNLPREYYRGGNL
jgi:hypothetical protein